jgi:hypothetical protein
MVASGTTWVHVLGVEQCAYLTKRMLQLVEFLAVEQRPPCSRSIERKPASHRRGFPGAVRTEEAGDAPIAHLKAEIIHHRFAAECLGESLNLNHAADVRRRRSALGVRLPSTAKIDGGVDRRKGMEEQIVFLRRSNGDPHAFAWKRARDDAARFEPKREG